MAIKSKWIGTIGRKIEGLKETNDGWIWEFETLRGRRCSSRGRSSGGAVPCCPRRRWWTWPEPPWWSGRLSEGWASRPRIYACWTRRSGPGSWRRPSIAWRAPGTAPLCSACRIASVSSGSAGKVFVSSMDWKVKKEIIQMILEKCEWWVGGFTSPLA